MRATAPGKIYKKHEPGIHMEQKYAFTARAKLCTFQLVTKRIMAYVM